MSRVWGRPTQKMRRVFQEACASWELSESCLEVQLVETGSRGWADLAKGTPELGIKVEEKADFLEMSLELCRQKV